jgi:hypothetical protein
MLSLPRNVCGLLALHPLSKARMPADSLPGLRDDDVTNFVPDR